MRVEVDSELSEGVQRTLDEVLARAKDMLPYFEEQAQALDALIQFDVYEESRSPFGDRWKELAESTVKMRRKGSGPSPQMTAARPLIDNGNMRRATFVRPERGYIEFGVGNDIPYAIHQQFGAKTKNGRDRPPARPFLPVSGTKDAPTVDFSRGPAKKWYDGMIAGLRVFLSDGETSGG